MKKALLFLIGLVMISGFILGDLQDIYEKGKITLKANEQFGRQTDWEDYFYDPYKWVAVSPGPNYSIFVANNRQHSVLKFDKNGNIQKKFGQKGLGPSDVNNPQYMTFLDNKYLVIGDSVVHRRITIWDLDGNFVDVVKTSKSPSWVTAVKNNKIAFQTPAQFASPRNGYKRKVQTILKDIKTRKEKVVREITLLDRSEILLTRNISTGLGNFFGEVFMVQTIEGNLAVGISNNPEINIYSPDGEKIHSFNLKIKPIAVDAGYIEKFKAVAIAEVKKNLEETANETRKFYYQLDLKVFPKFDFSRIFSTHLPLYEEILVDSEGNFLVFKYSDCLKNCKTIFQVYSQKGEFICETELDTGKYDIAIDPRFKTLRFTPDGIIGYATEKDDEDGNFMLFKSKY